MKIRIISISSFFLNVQLKPWNRPSEVIVLPGGGGGGGGGLKSGIAFD